MVKTLHRLGFIYKKPKRIPGKSPSREVQEAFVEKVNVNGAYNPLTQKVICIEEEGTINQDSNIALDNKILINKI